ncbi:MAG TPA: hypothetical protein DDW76_14220 [Cyanobacteria bacterium UBA11369]|nr:hypothetical protein [Cyanobacteria bacterium UBA11371]HBE32367.1 hypothetical protein [Cyanobacteria bacterium UBA11368]HBE49913.1 hypothetical protein [Cyanobacteria bacterium UBA11369]
MIVKTKFWQEPKQIIKTRIGVLLVVMLVIGIFFRFYNLDRKVYWHDEIYTSLRISGYTKQELTQEIFNGSVIGIEDLQKFQRPNREKNLIDTINSLAIEEPQHPPLYYAIARWWVEIFGYSVKTMRILPALISLLAFPCVYWLCWELFRTPLVGWVAIALIAISPFHVLYAQEARQFSLWAVTILLSSAALLRAMRLKTKPSWRIYGVTLALGFYTFPLTGMVAIAHGIYLWVIEGFRLSKTVASYLLASLAGLIAFLPWIVFIINNFTVVKISTEWNQKDIAKSLLLQWFGWQTSQIFIDLGDMPKQMMNLAMIIILTIIGYSIYFLVWRNTQKIWLSLLSMILVNLLPLILPDLIFGGQRSIVIRYLTPMVLGIQLAVAHLIATQIFGTISWSRKIGKAITILLMTGGIVSCAVSSQANNWNVKKNHHDATQIAQIINQTQRPLLMSTNNEVNIGEILSIGYLLNPKTKFQLVIEPNFPQIPDGVTDIFLFNPSQGWREKLEKDFNYKVDRVNPGELDLWKLTK